MPSASAGLEELTTLVRDCSVAGVARRALLVRTDLLPPRLAKPHHLRLAAEALEPLSGADRFRRHLLSDDRVAISWRGESAERVRQVLDSLALLLEDAALDAPSMPELVRLFDLPKDGAALLALASRPGRDRPAAGQQAAQATDAAPHPAAAVLPPLDLASLETVEARLAIASVARFARRRQVCRLDANAVAHGASPTFAKAWEARFLSIQELGAELCPGRNVFAEPWLFRRLTRMLDRRMLSLLSSPHELKEAGPFSLDLNVGGILAPEFQRFDNALPARLRGHTVLNLLPADIMADLSSFRFACAFARGKGHRILLRNITPPLMTLLNLAALELDFVELRWTPSLLGFDPAGLRAGSARWVLARADDETATRWGRAAGIGLFQGDAAQTGTGLASVRSAA